MTIWQGDVVDTTDGPGTVTDRDTCAGEVLVRLHTGSELDTSHGRWYPTERVDVTGYDPDAWVWYAGRYTLACNVRRVGE
jgi:hypothetical protein